MGQKCRDDAPGVRQRCFCNKVICNATAAETFWGNFYWLQIFHRRPHGRLGPFRALGLRLRNHTDSTRTLSLICIAGRNHRDPALHTPSKSTGLGNESNTLTCLDRDAALSRLHHFDHNRHFEKPVASSINQFAGHIFANLLHLSGPLTNICLITQFIGVSRWRFFHFRRSRGWPIGRPITGDANRCPSE